MALALSVLGVSVATIAFVPDVFLRDRMRLDSASD